MNTAPPPFAPSARYVAEVSRLYDWFAVRLPNLGPVRLAAVEYERGTDALTGRHAGLVRGAVRTWADEGYDLSYKQLCIAFFAAAQALGLLTVVREMGGGK